MVKADAERDYYADLELEPTADANEIKRQFKKLALKYHPDRNPGRELEYNSKFQAIQSANEVLTDPQQRAKYDASRIRSGLLHTYSNATPSTSRSKPTRPSTTNFPPPPPPPPFTAKKPHFAPQSSGAQKYTRFNRPETATWTGSTSSTDDSKARTSDYKAWESMRRGTGPIPQKRTAPSKAPRAPTFQAGLETNGATPKEPSPRRSGWDHFQETHANTPGVARANTSRNPTQTFDPRTPGEEPSTQSAYSHIFQERPTSSRFKTHMAAPPPPPPPNRPPIMKRHDPPPPFKDKVGFNEPFGNKPRVSTPYATGPGERTVFSSPGLQRSATSATQRDANNRTGFFDSKSKNDESAQKPAASASSNKNGTSPRRKEDASLPGMYSSSSSSSSSDEDLEPYDAPKPRVTQTIKTRRTRVPAGGQSYFDPYAKGQEFEPMAPRAGLNAGYARQRRHSSIDIDTGGTLESQYEHSKKPVSEKLQDQSGSLPLASEQQNRDGSQPPLQRSRSWHENKKNTLPTDEEHRPIGINQKDPSPMYEPPGYNPFSSPLSSGPPGTTPSDKWSDQWPFKSPKKPKTSSAEAPPYWAVPSSLPPPRVAEARARANTDIPFHINTRYTSFTCANDDPFNSFIFPSKEKNHFAKPSLRSQSSENINTKFSPDNWHGKFFEPPPLSRTNTPRTGVSPATHNMSKWQEEVDQTVASKQKAQIDPETIKGTFPSLPTAQDKFAEERWAQHVNDIKFDIQDPLPRRSPSRTATRKRPRTRPSRPVGVQPSVVDIEDESTGNGATGESLNSSKASSDDDAMDIDDPVLTPPSANANAPHANGHTIPANGADNAPRQAPPLPPRMNGHSQPQKPGSHLNLGNLKHVFPFAPSNEGLNNMNEMGTTLPAPAEASPPKCSDNTLGHRLRFPNPPLCPSSPLSLTQSSWDHYCLNMRRYQDEWTKFNSQMAEILKTVTQESLKCDWLNPEGIGYDKHMNMLNEHRRARVHWEVACDNHDKCMGALGDAMDAMVRGRGGVGRKQSNGGPVLEGLL